MATFYGDALTDDPTALPSIEKTASDYTSGARIRRTELRFTTSGTFDPGNTDEIRMGTLLSSNRILSMTISNDAFPAGSSVNIGLAEANGPAHDGATVSAVLFGTSVLLTSAVDRAEALTEAGVVTGPDRGKYLWEIANLGGSSHTSDPKIEYDIILTYTADAGAAADGLELVLDVEYVSGQ